MFPHVFGICLDFYLIGRLILHNPMLSAASSALLLSLFAVLWFVLPRSSGVRELVRRKPCLTGCQLVQPSFARWLHPADLVQSVQGPEPK